MVRNPIYMPLQATLVLWKVIVQAIHKKDSLHKLLSQVLIKLCQDFAKISGYAVVIRLELQKAKP